VNALALGLSSSSSGPFIRSTDNLLLIVIIIRLHKCHGKPGIPVYVEVDFVDDVTPGGRSAGGDGNLALSNIRDASLEG